MRAYTSVLTVLLLATPAFAQTAPAPATPAQSTPAQSMPAGTMPGKSMPRPGTAMMKLAVNTASEAQIAAVPGIGPKLAAAIVKGRPFKNSADLIKRVKGIGPKNYVKLGLDKIFTY